MDEAMESNQIQTCPQCDNHCPVDALSRCGHGHHGHDGEKHHHKHEGHSK